MYRDVNAAILHNTFELGPMASKALSRSKGLHHWASLCVVLASSDFPWSIKHNKGNAGDRFQSVSLVVRNVLLLILFPCKVTPTEHHKNNRSFQTIRANN